MKKKRARQLPLFAKEKHTASVMVHFTPSQMASLRSYANAKQMTVGACVRMMLVTYLNSPLKGKTP
jgi:hypothetical protein